LPVPDSQVAALRSFLLHDADGAMRVLAAQAESGTTGFQYLAEAALVTVARRRFAPTYTSADLIGFVASARLSRLADGEEFDLDPVIGESVLRYSLGQNVPRTGSADERFHAVVALLSAMTDGDDQARIEAVLDESRELASEWLDMTPESPKG
jgi:hypothetical protein